jgi:hypothetical protein
MPSRRGRSRRAASHVRDARRRADAAAADCGGKGSSCPTAARPKWLVPLRRTAERANPAPSDRDLGRRIEFALGGRRPISVPLRGALRQPTHPAEVGQGNSCLGGFRHFRQVPRPCVGYRTDGAGA